jgi:hypothetical protein
MFWGKIKLCNECSSPDVIRLIKSRLQRTGQISNMKSRKKVWILMGTSKGKKPIEELDASGETQENGS